MRRISLTAALAALAMLTGCVSIPSSGGVTTTEIEVEDQDNPLLSLPSSPAPDAGPAEIIAGFLRAGRGPQENYRVAREYLTDDFRKDWIPGARTLISSTPFAPVETGDGSWSVTISVGAAVDAHGRYQTASPADSYELEFTLVQDDDDQWRISSAPDGTVLSPDRFASIFQQFELYFFDPSLQFLVPDLRWYRSGASAAGRVVDELLMGPSERLGEGSLVSAFPDGARADDSVVADGVAIVELSSEVSSRTRAEQRRMRQQLFHSLRSVTPLRELEITVGGFALEIPDGGREPEAAYLVGNDPVGADADGRVGVLGADGVTRIEGIRSRADGLGGRGGAIVSRSRDRMVLLTDAGVVAVQAGRDPEILDGRSGLVVPTLDPLGWTWSVPAGDASAVRAISATGTVVPVPGLPAGGRVVSIASSRDGARLLVALDTESGPRLMVAGIRRDADLVPTALLEPLEIPVGEAPILDAAWIDGVTVVVLSDGPLTSVDAYVIGGQRTNLGALNDGRVVVGGNGEDGTRVLDGAGNIMRPGSGTSWDDTGIDAAFLIDQI